MATAIRAGAVPAERRWRAIGRTAAGRAELERLFRRGRFPSTPPSGVARGTFLGMTVGPVVDRAVDALAGLWMPWLGKAFDPAVGRGENVFASGPAWYAGALLWLIPRLGWPIRRDEAGRLRGFHFLTEPGRGVDDPGTEVLRIVYGHPSVPNPFPVSRVLDEVVEIEPGLLLGKAHLRWPGRRQRQVAFFALRFDPRPA
jgi:hypothetical protein